jgi:molybdopterin-guanine dinucleotide biosynthesis protein A
MKITSVILAGGKSRRLGRRKALESVGGRSIIERAVEQLKPLTGQILVVTSREQFGFPFACQAEILADLYPGKGPLGGIFTGLLASQSSQCLVVACDMPFLNTELLQYMIELSYDFDMVIPRLGEGMLEPLHAIYSKNCLGNIRSQLESDELKAYSVLNAMRVRYVERSECEKFDPQLLSFFNVNCQPDLDQAVMLASTNGHGF